jgi:hypothetical protein
MKTAARRAAQAGAAIVAPVLTVLMIAVLGIVLGWPLWVEILLGVTVVVGAVYVIRSLGQTALSATSRPRWLRWGQDVAIGLMVVASVGGAATMYGRWTLPDRDHTDQTHQVAQAATTIAQLLTSMTPDTRAQYLQQLRPLVTDDVAQALRDKVVIPLPTVPFSQKGVVRSVGIEAVTDSAAIAIAVVQPTPGPAARSVDPEPSDILLWLLLARYEDRWVLADLAPLGLRPGYPG